MDQRKEAKNIKSNTISMVEEEVSLIMGYKLLLRPNNVLFHSYFKAIFDCTNTLWKSNSFSYDKFCKMACLETEDKCNTNWLFLFVLIAFEQFFYYICGLKILVVGVDM